MVSNKMTQLTKHVDCIFTNIGRELSHQNWKIRNYHVNILDKRN